MGTTCHKSLIDFNKVLNYNYKIIDNYVYFNKVLIVKEFNYITNIKY
jgi:hypothetical protein